MQTYIVAGPAVEPVGLTEAKAQLRLDGTDEDDLVLALLAAARTAVESTTRLRLIRQTWRLVLESWPADRIVRVPLAPVASVAAVRVRRDAGTVETIAGSLVRLDGGGDPPRLVVDPAVPSPGVPAGGIEIDLLCGFGTAAADVPAPLRLAIRRLVARWFAERGDGQATALPADVAALVAPYARPRLVP